MKANETMNLTLAAGTQPARPQNAHRPQAQVIVVVRFPSEVFDKSISCLVQSQVLANAKPLTNLSFF